MGKFHRNLTLAAGVASLSAAAAFAHPSHPAQTSRSVLVVLAHPDDELVFAPAIAAETRSGADVRFVFVTSGDAGPGVSEYEPGEDLAKARRAEAQCSAAALGVENISFLEFGDGTLAEKPRAASSNAKAILAKLDTLVAEAKPNVVITWGPDGGYGHRDHRMVSALVTQTLQSRAPAKRPELFYPAMVHAPLPDMLQAQGWATTSPDLADLRYPYTEADLAAANAATQCHKTQFDEATRAMLTPGFHAAVWKGDVAFRSAFWPRQ